MNAEQPSSKPALRIEKIHIRGLKSIRALDWPAQGLGWGGAIPGVVLIGGANGSGKTTLLHWISQVFRCFELEDPVPKTLESLLCFRISKGADPGYEFSFFYGEQKFLNENPSPRHVNSFGFLRKGSALSFYKPHGFDVLRNAIRSEKSWPRVVFFPSEGRSLFVPHENQRRISPPKDPEPFVYHWQKPANWNGSLHEVLYHARWLDLNAKEEGKGEDAKNFNFYADAFAAFTEKRKRLAWPRGELKIETEDGSEHGLDELSSGEKQVLVLLAELLRLWRPGSLILIDEPELHLHDAWQSRFYQAILKFQSEKGGQVLLATQSNYLFQIGQPNTKVLLNMGDGKNGSPSIE